MIPIVFRRADPAALAVFDQSTKQCTMNCGQHRDDPRTVAECKLLCEDCIEVDDMKKTAPNDPTAVERRARYDERAQKRGIVTVQVKIPESRRDDLLLMAKKWRDEVGKKK